MSSKAASILLMGGQPHKRKVFRNFSCQINFNTVQKNFVIKGQAGRRGLFGCQGTFEDFMVCPCFPFSNPFLSEMEFHLTKKQETSDVRSQDEANYGLRGRSPGTGLPKVAAAHQQPAKDCQSCSNHGEEHFFYTMAPSPQPSCTSHPIGGG